MFEITQDAKGGSHQRVSIIQRVFMSPISYKLGCRLRAKAKIFRFQTSELYHIRNMTEFGLPLRGCSHSAAFVETVVWLCNTYLWICHGSSFWPITSSKCSWKIKKWCFNINTTLNHNFTVKGNILIFWKNSTKQRVQCCSEWQLLILGEFNAAHQINIKTFKWIPWFQESEWITELSKSKNLSKTSPKSTLNESSRQYKLSTYHVSVWSLPPCGLSNSSGWPYGHSSSHFPFKILWF